MIGHNACFSFDKHVPYYEQKLKLKRTGYITLFQDRDDNFYLHVYYSCLSVYDTAGYAEITINMPFNYANEYYFYIDYLYYRRVVNELNSVIFINGRYLINLFYFGKKREPDSYYIKEGDPRYNKDTHKLFLVETAFVYDYEKHDSYIIK
ncbi:MAG: hypothetical protein IRZ03_17815 [Acidobacterium ailaaui]|nr:hypothetical protein [Pseudacidobacterium ailaaui]